MQINIVGKIMLRDYQEKSITSLRDSFKKGNKHVGLMLPCGAGKTRVAIKIIENALGRDKKILFICDRIELINQTSKVLDEHSIGHGVIQADHERTCSYAPVQVCSIQTLARRKIPTCDLIIVDEFHTVYKTINKLMDKWNNIPVIGLSATPFTKGLGKNWDDLIVGVTTQELIDKGFLVPFTVYGPPGVDLSQVKTVAGDYNQGQLADAVDKPKLVADIVKTWLSNGEDRQTICFATNIAHSKHIVEEFKLFGVKAEHIDAYTDSAERRESLHRFETGETRVISSVDILTKGYDQPLASCLIAARPTKSLTVHVQMTGRVLRIAEGKKDAIILDHAGNTSRLGFVTDPLPAFLDMGKKGESKNKKKEEPLPKPCPKCHFMKPAKTHECPNCGFKPEKQNIIETEAGELKKIKKADAGTKRKWFGMLLYIARQKKYSDGWAAHKYREKFGVWPRGVGDSPIEADTEVWNYFKHLQIKHAKSKKKKIKSCRYCGGTDFKELPGKGPHKAGIGCNSCGRHLGWVGK